MTVTEFNVQRAIQFVHEYEIFRRKFLKRNGRGRGRIREGKERGPRLDILSCGLRVPSYAIGYICIL